MATKSIQTRTPSFKRPRAGAPARPQKRRDHPPPWAGGSGTSATPRTKNIIETPRATKASGLRPRQQIDGLGERL